MLKKLRINPIRYWELNTLKQEDGSVTNLLDSEKIIGDKCWLLQDGSSYYNYYLVNYDPKQQQLSDDYFQGCDETKRIIFSTIKESQLKPKKLRHQGIEGIVDKLQEDDAPEAEVMLAFYHITKAVEALRKYKKIFANKIPDRNNYYYDRGLGVVTKNTYGNPIEVTICKLKDISVSELLRVLIDQIDLPRNISVKSWY